MAKKSISTTEAALLQAIRDAPEDDLPRLAYADYYAAMKDDHGALKSNLGDDGVHPNAQGYALMRPIAEKAVAQALARP